MTKKSVPKATYVGFGDSVIVPADLETGHEFVEFKHGKAREFPPELAERLEGDPNFKVE